MIGIVFQKELLSQLLSQHFAACIALAALANRLFARYDAM